MGILESCMFHRAAAVVWSRKQGESVDQVIVSAVYDFGVVSLTPQAKQLFGEQMDNALPGVDAHAWDARFEPVGAGVGNPVEWMSRCRSDSELYPQKRRPVHTFPAHMFREKINDQDHPIQDFTMDWANLIWTVAVLLRTRRA